MITAKRSILSFVYNAVDIRRRAFPTSSGSSAEISGAQSDTFNGSSAGNDGALSGENSSHNNIRGEKPFVKSSLCNDRWMNEGGELEITSAQDITAWTLTRQHGIMN